MYDLIWSFLTWAHQQIPQCVWWRTVRMQPLVRLNEQQVTLVLLFFRVLVSHNDNIHYFCSTYIGSEYSCMENVIIPSMNGQIEAGAASFSAHMGDICGKFNIPPCIILFSLSLIHYYICLCCQLIHRWRVSWSQQQQDMQPIPLWGKEASLPASYELLALYRRQRLERM